MKFKNGFSDGSGVGIITINEKAILKANWGCSCCESEVTQNQIKMTDKIVKILNKHEKELKELAKEHEK